MDPSRFSGGWKGQESRWCIKWEKVPPAPWHYQVHKCAWLHGHGFGSAQHKAAKWCKWFSSKQFRPWITPWPATPPSLIQFTRAHFCSRSAAFRCMFKRLYFWSNLELRTGRGEEWEDVLSLLYFANVESMCYSLADPPHLYIWNKTITVIIHDLVWAANRDIYFSELQEFYLAKWGKSIMS